jgi:hypothetical protein
VGREQNKNGAVASAVLGAHQGSCPLRLALNLLIATRHESRVYAGCAAGWRGPSMDTIDRHVFVSVAASLLVLIATVAWLV